MKQEVHRMAVLEVAVLFGEGDRKVEKLKWFVADRGWIQEQQSGVG